MRAPIRRIKSGKSFRYEDLHGPVTDPEILDRIKSLAIPPAWTDVQIASSAKSKIQAMGTDSAGRAQYIYHTKHHAKQAAAKFDRITSFGANLPKLRQQVEKDLSHREFDKQKVLACAVSLMDEVYFRVGNHKYASEHQSYGLTTLRSKHVSVDGHTVMFDFVGKSGQQQHKEITDRQLATIIKTLDEMPGYEIFRYYDNEGNIKDLTSADVNEYIKGIMGDDYSAKDFRTWGGTLLACIELANLPRPRKKTERTKAITECVQKVAERLGNTPAIARSSYIDPRIFKMFESSDQLAKIYQTVKTIKKSNYLSSDEQCVVKILSV